MRRKTWLTLTKFVQHLPHHILNVKSFYIWEGWQGTVFMVYAGTIKGGTPLSNPFIHEKALFKHSYGRQFFLYTNGRRDMG